MKKRFTKLLSMVLALSLFLSMVPTSFAEEEDEGSGEASAVVSETLQVVGIASEKKDKLEKSETTYYKEKVDALSDGSRESVTVEKDEKTLVYTLKDGDADEKVLQEYEYASSDGAALSLQTYSEIHLKETPAEADPESPSENASEGVSEDSQDQAVSNESAPESGEPAVIVNSGDAEASEPEVNVESETEENADPASNEEEAAPARNEENIVNVEEAAEEYSEEEADTEDSGEAFEEDAEVEFIDEGEEDSEDEFVEEDDENSEDESIEEGEEDSEDEFVEEDDENSEEEFVEEGDDDSNDIEETDPDVDEEEEENLTLGEKKFDSEEDIIEEDSGVEFIEEDDENSNDGEETDLDVDEEEEDLTQDEDAFSEDEAESNEDEAASDEDEAEPDEGETEPDEAVDSDPEADLYDENEVFDSEYISEEEIRITAEELLNRILSGDDMAIAFANSLGFGRTVDELVQNLTAIVDEYRANPDFVEPAFTIRDVRLTLDREITEETQDGLEGYRTTVNVDSSATVEIRYDERGEAQVTRRVPTDTPTDFIITLDVSYSMMDWGEGRDNAMFSALRVVLDEILASPENTVSIIFWSNDAALMRLDVDGDGITETTFSGSEGYTAELIYDQAMISESGNVSDIILSESYDVIDQIEDLYNTGCSTEPDRGLDQALALLEAMTRDEGRNLGVLLFTDGAADSTYNEHRTVANEQELAERFNARIVNVSIGDENTVRQYERYLDPESDSYYEPDSDVLRDRVLYYNIPTVSNEELAERVTEMFDIAFQDIMSETRELTSETVTAGILAAVSARVIETVPAGFQVLTTDGHSYTVEGTDEDGNTVISFTLDNLISGDTASVSYFVVPTSADTDIGLTAYTAEAGTTLFAEPVDRILMPEEEREVQIVYSSNGHATRLRPDRRHPDSHSDFYDYEGSDEGHISAADEQRLINQFVQMMLEAGVNWELIGECVDYLDDTDDEKMKEMWLTMFSSPDLLDIRTLAEGSYQGQSGTQIYVNLDISSPYFMPRTIFHEVGHAVDNMTGRLQANTQSQLYYTNSTARVDGIADDVRSHVEAQAAAKVDAYIQGLQYTAWAFGNDSDLTQAQQSRDQLIGYLTDRIMYTNLPWMYEDGAVSEADLERRLVDRYFGGVRPDFADTNQLVNDIRADFTTVQPDLLDCTDLANGTDWQEAYAQCISDVYGGVTNKYLDDGYFHLDGYWYDGYFGSRIDCHMAVEPWAEYTEARLMNTPNALDVVNEFLPSYRFEETEDEMYQLMMNYLDQHGIQNPTAA